MKLRTRIIISVVITSTIVNLFLCFYFTDRIREYELTSLNERIEKSVYVMKLVNATPVYNVDKETVRLNLETFFDDENMKQISFQEYDINIMLKRTFSNPKGQDIEKSFHIFHKGLKLGKVNVVYSTSLIEEKLDRFKIQVLWVTLIGVVVLSFLLAIIVDRLMQPISELTLVASEIAAGNLDRKIANSSSGEVGELSRNFAVMRDAIKDKINDLAKINENLEKEVQLKALNEVKILKQSQVINSVNYFFQKTMQAQTFEEISQIFIPIILKVIPSKYCFIGELKPERPGFMDLLAVSDQILSDCAVSRMDQVVLSQDQEILGIRQSVIHSGQTIIATGADPEHEFVNFPENRLSIDSLLAVPMKLGDQVVGMVVIAGRNEGYDQDDKKAAQTLSTALVESLRLKRREIEKEELQEMMVHSEKMISIGGLAAGMAHEINNPLAGILQNTQVVMGRLRDKLPANIKAAEELELDFDHIQAYMEKRNVYKLMNLVMDAGKRAAEIVSNMLSFSRKSNSGFLSENICELLDKTLNLAESDYSLREKFDFKMIKINKFYEDDLPRIQCKASEIQQVFFNLLSNGAQAMLLADNDKTPYFDLKVYQTDQMISVEIGDNGPGMDEEIRKRVFEPFFTTKNVGEGTGLGLSVSYFIIVENHKGSIEVSSSPGRGTLFTIKLPIT